MLRTFTPQSTFRGLAPEPFPSSDGGGHLGRCTIIYGRNGSGKSTFSEFLRQLARHDGNISPLFGSYFDTASGKVQTGEVPSTVVHDIHVFNRFYVDHNLGQFLDGEELGDLIVVLGQDNVAARKAVNFHETEITRQQARMAWAEEQSRQAEKSRKSSIEAVKTSIITALEGIDPVSFNTTRFNVTKSEALLQNKSAKKLSETEHKTLIETASESNKDPLKLSLPSFDFAGLIARIEEIVRREVTNVAIDSLLDNQLLSAWVERGLELHEEGESCKFCASGILTPQRVLQFKNHFNDALQVLRADSEKVLDDVERHEKLLESEHWLPQPGQILSNLENDYHEAWSRWSLESTTAQQWLADAKEVLTQKISDPLTKIDLPNSLASAPSLVELDSIQLILDRNDEECKDQAAKRSAAIDSIQSHFAAAELNKYDLSAKKHSYSLRLKDAITRITTTHRSQIVNERARMSNTSQMAGHIDNDLSTIFGHDHLRVEVSADTKGYRITRRGNTAANLSEGERHSIALLYFLRTLEREGITPHDDLVVVDDPVTSLDRDALFAAQSLLSHRLKNFGQTVLLTHDFELYRLSVMSNKSSFDSSRKRIAENDSNEVSFPSVNFLEIIAERTPGSTNRESRIRTLPVALLRHPSEYHYLFWCVADSLTTANESIIPLLGNAARRLLEGFISFKAPNGASFQHKIDLTTELAELENKQYSAQLAEIKERVVRFAHGMSHRSEPIPTTGLNFIAVRDELRKVLHFIQLCDPQHFKRIAEAVNIDIASIRLQIEAEEELMTPMPLHVFGWIPSVDGAAYAEVVRPGLSVYAVDLLRCDASAVSSRSGAGQRGLWIFTSVEDTGVLAHAVRTDNAAKYLRTNDLDTRWSMAFYVSGSGAQLWQKQHQHFIETSIRMEPSKIGASSVQTPAVSTLPKYNAGIEGVCVDALDALPLIMQTLSSMLKQDQAKVSQCAAALV